MQRNTNATEDTAWRRFAAAQRPGERGGVSHLRCGCFERLDLAAPVRATRRADPVCALGLVALRALHERGSCELVGRTPLVAARLRGLSLGDGHRGGEV